MITPERLRKDVDRIDEYCFLMARIAREKGLTFEEGAIAALSLSAVMSAMNHGISSQAQLQTMLRELIESQLSQIATPIAGKARVC